MFSSLERAMLIVIWIDKIILESETIKHLIYLCSLVMNSLLILHAPSIKWLMILESSSHSHSSSPYFLSITGWCIDLDYCDIEWFTLETNRDHCVIFEIASKYCISDSFVDHDGYSSSSKRFLPTVVDITVIWVKFTHSSPPYFTDS